MSNKIGADRAVWRYDPILSNEKHTIEKHIVYFEVLARLLKGYTKKCVISFVDVYKNIANNIKNRNLETIKNEDMLILALRCLRGMGALYMNTKDWILLLVPILLNGIIIYGLQSLAVHRLDRVSEKKAKRQKISEEFFVLLLQTKANFRTLGYSLEAGDYGSFDEKIRIFNQSIRIFLNYYDDYKPFLTTYGKAVEKLSVLYDEYVEFGRTLHHVDHNDHNRLSGYINELFAMINDVSKLYVKDI